MTAVDLFLSIIFASVLLACALYGLNRVGRGDRGVASLLWSAVPVAIAGLFAFPLEDAGSGLTPSAAFRSIASALVLVVLTAHGFRRVIRNEEDIGGIACISAPMLVVAFLAYQNQ